MTFQAAHMIPVCREGVRMNIDEQPGSRSVLITGASGEIGHGLIKGLRVHDDIHIVANRPEGTS